jgi:hypothetical protein
MAWRFPSGGGSFQFVQDRLRRRGYSGTADGRIHGDSFLLRKGNSFVAGVRTGGGERHGALVVEFKESE